MATSSTYSVGTDGSNIPTGGNGMAPVALAPGTSGAGIFSNALTQLLATVQAQNAANTGSQGTLTQAQAALTNESVAPGGPVAFNPAFSADSQVGNQQTMQAAFHPAIAGVAAQAEASADQTNAIKGEIETINASPAMQKYTLSQGQTLTDAAGNKLLTTPNFGSTPVINTTSGSAGYGNLDYWDSANGMWKSDETATGSANNPVTDANGNTTPSVIQHNNDPYGVKFSPFTQKLASSLGISATIGSGAIDGGNFMQFSNAADATKLARALITSGTYANDTVDQALKTWSNFGWVNPATGKSTGYDGSILDTINASPNQSSHLDPQAKISDLSGTQLDTLMSAMLVAEQGANNTDTTQPETDPFFNIYSPAAGVRVAKIPVSQRRFLAAGPDGVVYADGDMAAQAGFLQDLTLNASGAGIPILSTDGITIMDNINTLVEHVASMQTLVNQNLPGGPGGSAASNTGSTAESFFAGTANSVLGDSPNLTQLQTYIGGITSAANTIKTLSGGAGTGVRITGVEIAGITNNLPATTDSWQTANAKIIALNTDISQIMHTNFPDASPTAPVTPQIQATAANGGGTVTMTGPGGTYSVPQSQVAVMQQNGYTQQ
jgi:hypothetical protein